MLSWRGAVDGSAGVGRFLILLLLDDVRIVPGASSETALDQQVMQVNQRRYRHARRADRHSGAGDRIQHPRRDHRNHAGRRLEIDKAASDALLTAMASNTTPIKGVPAIMDLDLLPDMGRMSGRLRLAARITCSPAPMPAAAAPPPSTP